MTLYDYQACRFYKKNRLDFKAHKRVDASAVGGEWAENGKS